jgi:hypothetical protein
LLLLFFRDRASRNCQAFFPRHPWNAESRYAAIETLKRLKDIELEAFMLLAGLIDTDMTEMKLKHFFPFLL